MLTKYDLINSVHLQASDHNILQPSTAPNGQDNLNKNLPNNQADSGGQAHSKSTNDHINLPDQISNSQRLKRRIQ